MYPNYLAIHNDFIYNLRSLKLTEPEKSLLLSIIANTKISKESSLANYSISEIKNSLWSSELDRNIQKNLLSLLGILKDSDFTTIDGNTIKLINRYEILDREKFTIEFNSEATYLFPVKGKKSFTQIYLSDYFKLSKKSAKVFYLMLKKYSKTGRCLYTVSEIYDSLGIASNLSKERFIKQINDSIIHLEEHSIFVDLKANFIADTKGKIQGVEFSFDADATRIAEQKRVNQGIKIVSKENLDDRNTITVLDFGDNPQAILKIYSNKINKRKSK